MLTDKHWEPRKGRLFKEEMCTCLQPRKLDIDAVNSLMTCAVYLQNQASTDSTKVSHLSGSFFLDLYLEHCLLVKSPSLWKRSHVLCKEFPDKFVVHVG